MGLVIAWVLAAVPLPAQAAEQAEPTQDGLPGYRISAEDLLEISVWKEEDLQGEVIVRPDGGISFPLVGDIQAAGKTTSQLEADIAERLRVYIPDAVVTVSVLELRGLRIYVSGSVENPGQYTVGRYVDVLQAITLAGGLTPFANERDIRVIRREDGREKVYHFDYRQVQRGRNLEQNILLEPDDVVVVP
jgi:polysaccharide export outer membrane protein